MEEYIEYYNNQKFITKFKEPKKLEASHCDEASSLIYLLVLRSL